MKFERPIQMFPSGSIETPPSGYVNLYLGPEGYLMGKLPNGREIRIRHD